MPKKVNQNPYVNTLVVLFPDNLKVTNLCIWNRSVCHSLLCLLPWLCWQSWLSKAAGCSDHPESHQQLLCECDVIFTQTDLLCVVWHGEHWDLHCRISKAGLVEYVVNQMSGIDQQAAGADMSCIKDSKRSLVWYVLELTVYFNLISLGGRMGHIVMFVKSVYVVYICTFYWMLFGLCVGIWCMFFVERGTCRWNYCIYLNWRGSPFTECSFQENRDHV